MNYIRVTAARCVLPALLFLSVACPAQTTDANAISLSHQLFTSDALIGQPSPVYDNCSLNIDEGMDSTQHRHVDLGLFDGLGKNIVHSFSGDNLYYHIGAIAATAIIVPTDVDYKLEHFFNTHPQYTGWAHPVGFTGELLPFIAGGSLLAYAELKSDDETLGASFAVIQASLLAVTYNSFLKAITGRPGPNWRRNSNMEDLSETFRFGFLRGGIYWGWPSGHTVASMAVVSALTNYYPDKTWLKIVGYGLVGYTMAAVTANNRGGMHWFSDAVAGALMSYTIGSSVGTYFRDEYNGEASAPSSTSFKLSPTFYPAGVNLSVAF